MRRGCDGLKDDRMPSSYLRAMSIPGAGVDLSVLLGNVEIHLWLVAKHGGSSSSEAKRLSEAGVLHSLFVSWQAFSNTASTRSSRNKVALKHASK